ncbi:hypothetical protein FRC04_007731 [Tulasnella sp. 424]|nr:hypothetical protein FRC04_007731 [Tulasnella sp. 424]
MNSAHSIFTPLAIVKLGILSSGFTAGYAFSASHLGVYSLLQSPGLTSSQIAIAFDRLFLRSIDVFHPLVGISSLSYLYAARALRSSSHETLLGLSTPVQLVLAGVSVLLALPWTLIRMMPGMNRLRAVSSRAEKGEASAGDVADITTVRADLADWGYGFSISHLGVYSLLQSPGLTSSQIAIAFDRILTRATKVLLPLLGISSLSYFYAARALQSSTHETLLGLSTPVQLAVAGLSVLLTIPWTRIKMTPGINRLRAVSSRTEKGAASAGDVADITTVRADLADWGWNMGVKGVLISVACVLGATAL